MKTEMFLGATVLCSAFLAVASITYSETVRAHDEAMIQAKAGYIGCTNGYLAVRNITFENIPKTSSGILNLNKVVCPSIEK